MALDFVVMHFDAVAMTGAWAGLPRACADAVAAEVLTLLLTSCRFASECCHIIWWALNQSIFQDEGQPKAAWMLSGSHVVCICTHCMTRRRPPHSQGTSTGSEQSARIVSSMAYMQAASRFKHSIELMRKMTAQNKAAAQER